MPGAKPPRLQWGRGLSTAEIWPTLMHRPASPLFGFNGAAVFQPRKWRQRKASGTLEQVLQWGRGLSTAEMRCATRCRVAPEAASMGPRSFNRGNRVCLEQRSRRGGPKLQWGRGLSTAEIPGPRQAATEGQGLQWGRGLSTAEITSPLLRPQFRKTPASMGPRSFNRGNAMI